MQFVESFLVDLDVQTHGEMKANFSFDRLLGVLQELFPKIGILEGPRGEVEFEFLPLGLFCHEAPLIRGQRTSLQV